MPKRLRVDIWSDIACPWCYVGKRRLEAALALFAASPGSRARTVEVTWHSFQLDPSAPRSLPSDPPYASRLAAKYGVSPAQGQAMIARMVQTAAQDGIAMDFARIRPGNTFDAHRLLHLAKRQGRQDALEERLLSAYLCEGQAIGEPEVLLRLAEQAGLDVDQAQAVLATDAHADEVRADIAQARALGVSGVPFFVVGERYGVSGAQSPETLLAVLTRGWDETPEVPGAEPNLAGSPDGPVCGPDGCI